MIEVEKLIAEMQEVKAVHPGLELQDILRIFHIKATQELAGAMRQVANSG